MDELGQVLAAITTKVADLTAQYGADAVNLAGFVVQMEFAGRLVVGALCAAAALALVLIYLKVVVPAIGAANPTDNADRAFFTGIASMPFVIGIVPCCIGAISMFTPLYWAAAFNPYVALAAKAFEIAR